MRALSEPPGGRAGAALRALPSVPSDRETAVRTLYEDRHAELVRFATFIMGDVQAGEDASQEAFARVYDAWDRLEDPDRAVAYLRATVVNLSRGRHRRRLVAERKQPPRPVAVAIGGGRRDGPGRAAARCSKPSRRCPAASGPAS